METRHKIYFVLVHLFTFFLLLHYCFLSVILIDHYSYLHKYITNLLPLCNNYQEENI